MFKREIRICTIWISRATRSINDLFFDKQPNINEHTSVSNATEDGFNEFDALGIILENK